MMTYVNVCNKLIDGTFSIGYAIGWIHMVDKFSKETRSYIMSRIRGKDTKPEILVRSYLFSRGLRFRKNDRRYPGSPDVVLPKYNTMVFVHGCFWHLHDGCKYAKMPKSNVDYWEKKLYGNRERDERNRKELEDMGLAAPALTYIMLDLKKAGFDVDRRADTIPGAVESILSAMGKPGGSDIC